MAILTAARYADLVGITTVAGNAALEHTTRNALVTCELAGDRRSRALRRGGAARGADP